MTDQIQPDAPSRSGRSRSRAAKARDAVTSTLEDGAARARRKVEQAAASGADLIDGAPLTALAGAIAVGAVAAALIPGTAREIKAIGPLGGKARDALQDAFAAAKAAGAEQLTAKGLTSTALTNGVGQLVGHVITAALAASAAAGESVKERGGSRERP